MLCLPCHTATKSRQHTRPARWGLLAIAVTSLVSLGNGEPPDYGRGVGILDDGTLVIEQAWSSKYVSTDGGSTWQPTDIRVDDGWRQVWNVHEQWQDAVHWGDEEVETPRGTFVIETTEIEGTHALVDVSVVRIDGDGKEVVYSPPHLQDEADVRFRDRQHSARNEFPWSAPRNLVYHTPSGNIVAVLGLEGVVIGDTDGNWRPLLTEIGDRPVDVSFSNKMALVLGELWPIAALISISATAGALSFIGQRPADEAAFDGAYIPFLFGTLTILIALAAIYALVGSGLLFDIGDSLEGLFAFNAIVSLLGSIVTWRKGWPDVAVSGLIAGSSVPLIVVVAILGLFVDGGFLSGGLLVSFMSIVSLAGAVAIWIKARFPVGVSSLLLACIISVVGLAVVHTRGPSVGVSGLVEGLALGLTLSGGFVWSLMAFISFVPSYLRQLHVVFAALFVMVGLIVLAFAIGVAQGFNLGAAKLYTIVLVLPAVLALRWYTRRYRAS